MQKNGWSNGLKHKIKDYLKKLMIKNYHKLFLSEYIISNVDSFIILHNLFPFNYIDYIDFKIHFIKTLWRFY